MTRFLTSRRRHRQISLALVVVGVLRFEHERLHKEAISAGRLLTLLLDSGQQRCISTLKSVPFKPGLQIDALLLLQPHDCHILLLRCILYANVVLVVLEAVFEGWTLYDLSLHHDVKLRVLFFALHDFNTDPLAQDCEPNDREKEQGAVQSELLWLSLQILI